MVHGQAVVLFCREKAQFARPCNSGFLRLFFLDLKSPTYDSWTILAGDTNAWFLSAILFPPPIKSVPYDSNIWQGRLEVPAVKLLVVKH